MKATAWFFQEKVQLGTSSTTDNMLYYLMNYSFDSEGFYVAQETRDN